MCQRVGISIREGNVVYVGRDVCCIVRDVMCDVVWACNMINMMWCKYLMSGMVSGAMWVVYVTRGCVM